jgi:acyl-CoA-binding protein
MSDIQDEFTVAVAEVEKLPDRPDNQDLLRLYALYKQATVGDAAGKRPGMIDFVKRAKYDAWSEHSGTSREDAMRSYVDLVEELKAR